ncbi:MAG: carboxypeptidase-like regulatory domain-containing protein, partial [Chitinophagaceae bacterium]|nr:carboxypeptidase-like regulatory domain-containing protein [Chitinophagaceae bacterium]
MHNFKPIILLLICAVTLTAASAQEKFTISGYVKDSTSNETIIGATISVKGRTKGISSNQYGFYSITLDKGSYTLTVSHVGFTAKEIDLDLNSNTQLNFDLAPRIAISQEVIIYSKKR